MPLGRVHFTLARGDTRECVCGGGGGGDSLWKFKEWKKGVWCAINACFVVDFLLLFQTCIHETEMKTGLFHAV